MSDKMKKESKLFVAIPFEREADDVIEIEIVSINVIPRNKKKVAESLMKAYEGNMNFNFVPPLEVQMQTES